MQCKRFLLYAPDISEMSSPPLTLDNKMGRKSIKDKISKKFIKDVYLSIPIDKCISKARIKVLKYSCMIRVTIFTKANSVQNLDVLPLYSEAPSTIAPESPGASYSGLVFQTHSALKIVLAFVKLIH